jgi:hypothetical protein
VGLGRVLCLLALLTVPFCGYAGISSRSGVAIIAKQAGRDGHVVVASGCKDWVQQTVATISGTFETDSFEVGGAADLICGANPSFSRDEIGDLLAIVAKKKKRLLESDFVTSPQDSSESPKTWGGLKLQIHVLGEMIKQLATGNRDLGCAVGQLGSEDPTRKYNICFTVSFRGIENDGSVMAEVTMKGTAFKSDGVLAEYGSFEERVPVSRLPERCDRGGVKFVAHTAGASSSGPFVRDVSSSCEGYTSSYSGSYSGLDIIY